MSTAFFSGNKGVGSARLARGLRVFCLAILGGLASAGCQSNAGLESESSKESNRAKGEYIVEVTEREGAADAIRAALSEYGVESIGALETNRPLYVVELAEDPGPEAVSKRIADVDRIVSVQPNYKYSTGGSAGGAGGSAEHAEPGAQ